MNPDSQTDQYLVQQPMWVPNDVAASRAVESSVGKSMTLIRATVSQPLPELIAPVDKSPENLGLYVSALQTQKHLENRELMRDRLLLFRGMVQSVHAQNKVAEAALKAELKINKELHKTNTESDKKLREYQAKLARKGVSPQDIEALRRALEDSTAEKVQMLRDYRERVAPIGASRIDPEAERKRIADAYKAVQKEVKDVVKDMQKEAKDAQKEAEHPTRPVAQSAAQEAEWRAAIADAKARAKVAMTQPRTWFGPGDYIYSAPTERATAAQQAEWEAVVIADYERIKQLKVQQELTKQAKAVAAASAAHDVGPYAADIVAAQAHSS
jgi:hypothetical protein